MEFFINFIWYVLKCIHLVLGFILFGVIYYLGMFTSGVIRRMDKESRKNLVPHILPAYFHWLKWEAVWTILSGIALVIWKFFVMKFPFYLFSKNSFFIFIGMTLTITITIFIWFWILPMQNKILKLTEEGLWTEELDLIVMKSRKFSHICSWLGIIVVICMVSSNYFPLNF
ncbi:MAG: hypothetical protein KDK36_18760 [Leptospiraceae bacterium]|nr:hypothetical protein [Leptospiraceae bacterium]